MPFLAEFDARWQDAAEYLDALRRDLGEGRRLDLVPDYLTEQVALDEGTGMVIGPEAMGRALAARLAALPGLTLQREDILWAPSAENAFVAAQRFQSAARHDGQGLYGPPTGKMVRYTAMSESWCVAGALRAEWLLRDETAILEQIGISLEDGARMRLSQMPPLPPPPPAAVFSAVAAAPLIEKSREPEMPTPGNGNDDAWGHTLGDLVHRIMGGELSVIARHYDAAAELFYPGAIVGAGPRDAEAFWLGLRAAFPSAEFRVHHLLGAEEPLSPPRAAIRWSLSGKHDGHGAFGAPSGAKVNILGLTHAEFGPDGLRREWTLYDQPGVMAQILRSAG
ncbi:ester cyclase [Citreicella sp. C3M06]|uniref:nuclear transport factor 2 family protein n=1 Tax=Citreicella sp. C3M06 TaxID=2841564 RepID=UPI001C082622|nr:ester cyclase [Citreicella sp. C3M06]MBU2959510.1 ester cyclase [Citreicella sp. C3M06]